MRPSSSDIFHTSLAFLLSSLSARRDMRVGNRGVRSQRYCTTGSRYEAEGMEASSWVVISAALRKVA
jgi:hypothetical protein